MRIIYRGVYAGFPAAALHTGDLAYATDLLVLFISDSTAWVPYHDYPDYQGDKSGLYLQPEWSTREGTDRTLHAVAGGQIFGGFACVDYTVPTGRTLYVTYIAFRNNPVGSADSDKMHLTRFHIEVAGGATHLEMGGQGGGAVSLNKPLVFTTGQRVLAWCYNYANHSCNLSSSIGGYEV